MTLQKMSVKVTLVLCLLYLSYSELSAVSIDQAQTKMENRAELLANINPAMKNRLKGTLEGKTNSGATNDCEAKYAGKCIDTRLEMCDDPVVDVENLGCKTKNGAAAVKCCPFYYKKSHRVIKKEDEACKVSYWHEVFKDGKSVDVIGLGKGKVSNGKCVDILSNKEVCRNDLGNPRPTLTGSCPGPWNMRCCPEDDWYNVNLRTKCEEQDDKKVCEKFQAKLKKYCHSNQEHAKFNIENHVKIELKDKFDSGDIKWEQKKRNAYKNPFLDPEKIKVDQSGKYATVSFTCHGDNSDSELCYIVFPCNVDLQKLLYRRFQESSIDGERFNFFYKPVSVFTFSTTNIEPKRTFEVSMTQEIEMHDWNFHGECKGIKELYKLRDTSKKKNNKKFFEKLEQMMTNKDEALKIIGCMKFGVEYKISEVKGKGKTALNVIMNAGSNSKNSRRRQLLQNSVSRC